MQKYVAVLAALAVFTAGCSHRAQPRLAARKPLAVPRAAIAEPGAAVWNLRAGLNVAALACKGRGRVSVRGHYGRLLTRHRTLLASAYSAEQHRQGARLTAPRRGCTIAFPTSPIRSSFAAMPPA